MEKKLIVLIFMGIFFMSFISAVPPVTTVDNFPEGYLLTESQQGALIYNQDLHITFCYQMQLMELHLMIQI